MTSTRGGRAIGTLAWLGLWVLVLVVVVFFVVRVTTDVSTLRSGALPPEGDFDRRYAENPVLAYLHIIPGMVYLLGAPLQLSTRIREANIRRHRAIGRIVLPAGVVTAVFAIMVGLVMPFGRFAEASASFVFGSYFLACLLLAFSAIRGGAVTQHRRWMLRAFAVGAGVGMIRIVVGLGEAFGVGIESSFGAAFWIAFALMAVLAEVWLTMRPEPHQSRSKSVSAA